ncbi:hypothetical protein T12_4960 [Trichinella patagoniensis]|uniref:Uncharacterized protein n=1 Tax=Trichinella patagoniensis TaxID=990121 RepID=A0A0V0Z5N1_9BILA|nr:hypothetical protein T12_4960 [Trichinella patagoniensis]
MDGTFKIVPEWYQQMFTIHVFIAVTDAISKKDHLETFADINSITLNIRKLTIEEKPKFDK